MSSLVAVFMLKTKLMCESAYICWFSFRFYLMRMCIFKNVMGVLFMET
jgi:hypothetical protein